MALSPRGFQPSMQSSLHHASLGPSLSAGAPQTASALSPILTVTYSDRCIGYNVAALQSRPSPADMKRLLLPRRPCNDPCGRMRPEFDALPYGSCATQPSKPQAVRTSAAPELKAKAQAAADDAGKPASCIVAAPLFRPDFRAGVRFDETQRMRFSFSKEAVSEGAPEQIPDFSASIIVKGDSISASLSALNTPFWRISATPLDDGRVPPSAPFLKIPRQGPHQGPHLHVLARGLDQGLPRQDLPRLHALRLGFDPHTRPKRPARARIEHPGRRHGSKELP